MISVRVPATTANLGSGYDTAGLALTFYNEFTIREILPVGSYRLEIVGEGLVEAQNPKTNGVILGYEAACREWGMNPPGLDLLSVNSIPFCWGLGSSSSAIVGGVLLANELRETPAPKEELLPIMVALEGHPDNVVPCCLGGMVISCWDGANLRYVCLPCGEAPPAVVVAVPDVRVPTPEARAVLPKSVLLEDAVFNLSRSALLAASWSTGQWENLSWAMEDRLHQPFRSELFPGGKEILEQLQKMPECDGVAISGSGPSMLAFTRGKPELIARSMCRIFDEAGVSSRFLILGIDEVGATVSPSLS